MPRSTHNAPKSNKQGEKFKKLKHEIQLDVKDGSWRAFSALGDLTRTRGRLCETQLDCGPHKPCDFSKGSLHRVKLVQHPIMECHIDILLLSM